MAPKPRVFTAPDGKQFSSKAEYRDYLMATFYSWKDKSEGEWTKTAGEIDGQVFDMADSSGATFVVMDRTDQVQIDCLTNCKVFLGCCSSSIFIRDCTDCVFYTCGRQLRLRGVTNSKFFVYSQAEVHIEESEGVSFAPFNGGYTEQKDHFAAAGMSCDDNLWYDIFDHNDPDKTGAHWSLIPKSDYGEAWWPAGDVGTPYIPMTEPGTVQKVGDEGSNKDAAQAGKAFSMEDMRAQAGKFSVPPSLLFPALLSLLQHQHFLTFLLLRPIYNCHDSPRFCVLVPFRRCQYSCQCHGGDEQGG